jgi:uncharacterized membrane protein
MNERQNSDIVAKDHQLRSVFKTVTWRVIATLTTTSLVYIFTGELALAAEVGLIEVILKLIFYYIHERTWGSIDWGQMEHPLAQLPVSRPLHAEDLEIIEKRLEDLGYL